MPKITVVEKRFQFRSDFVVTKEWPAVIHRDNRRQFSLRSRYSLGCPRNKSVRRPEPDLLPAGALLYLARGKPRATVTALLQVLRDLVLAFVAPRAVLVAENLLLRQQVIVLSRQVKRPRLRPVNRWVLASIAGRFRDLLATILVVKPETVIR